MLKNEVTYATLSDLKVKTQNSRAPFWTYVYSLEH